MLARYCHMLWIKKVNKTMDIYASSSSLAYYIRRICLSTNDQQCSISDSIIVNVVTIEILMEIVVTVIFSSHSRWSIFFVLTMTHRNFLITDFFPKCDSSTTSQLLWQDEDSTPKTSPSGNSFTESNSSTADGNLSMEFYILISRKINLL